MHDLPVSIVIPVSSDKKIRECLASIDVDAEIIIVLNNNPSKEVIGILERDQHGMSCKRIFIRNSGCNLAKVFNLGIEAASNDRVILMNSDCIFPPLLIGKIASELDRYDVVKSRVDFDYSNKAEHLVAQCRRLFHQVFDGGKNLFGPGLAFHKDIRKKIGGYFFDELMRWGEDGDLSKRIYQSGLKCLILDENILHCPVSIKHDLIVAFKIGNGTRVKNKLLGISLLKSFFNDFWGFITDRRQRYRQAYRNGGLSLLCYFFTWRMAFYLGYYTEPLRRS